jgi:serine/threonine protein kinase
LLTLLLSEAPVCGSVSDWDTLEKKESVMTLNTGQKLGPYEIISAVGAGGMGEVFKARDTRLDRTVAIKILSAPIAGNPDIRQRFEREARAISSLNHPNICTLYDVGSENDTNFLVMEYLEGETLSARLSRGALPFSELLGYATQIADALDKAHRQGLIHRDLKPGNVMLVKSGAKLLDFGLAKLQPWGGVVQGVSGVTRTTPLTGEGTLVGTMQYMSPEQLEGREADARSDIFAFGAILFEMATGRRAFEGRSQASLIAAVLEREPAPVSQLAPLAPPALDRVVSKCLAKDPDARWQSARDLTDELRWIQQSGSLAGVPAALQARRRFRLRLSWAVATVATLVALGLAATVITRNEPEPRLTRFTIAPQADLHAVAWPNISPDGKYLAFQAADSSNARRIWIRPLDSLNPYPLTGTENTMRPFWSPDSRYLAYFSGDQLMKVPVGGGPSLLICEVQNGADGSWGAKDIIIFDGGITDSIRQVPASGGTPTAATKIDRARGERYHMWPWFLPDGEHFLFNTEIDSAGQSYTVLMLGSLRDNEVSSLARADSRVTYSLDGYLVYVTDNVLVAHPFSASGRSLTGEPVPLCNDVQTVNELAYFSTSETGILVYQRGQGSGLREIHWLGRAGQDMGQVLPPGNYINVALSADGKRLAYDRLDDRGNSTDIWVHDIERDVSSRLTFDPDIESMPAWSADGSTIRFTSDRTDGFFRIYEKAANGTGDLSLLIGGDSTYLFPFSETRDGRSLIVVAYYSASATAALWRLNLVDHTVDTLTDTRFNRWGPAVSPDGRFLAYESNESGRWEVYVTELNGLGGRWQVSAQTGHSPQWRSDGRELYYVDVDNDFMAVPVSTDNGFQVGTPVQLFNHRYYLNTQGTASPYQVSADGQRFLVVSPMQDISTAEFVVTQNWTAELDKH